MAPSSSRVPTELVEQIIANESSNKEFLEACSLVCHCWSAIARKHRFRELRTGRWSTSLVCNPTSTVPPYVRSLHLSTADVDKNTPPWLASGLFGGPGSTRRLDDILQTIRVADLTALESLRVDDVTWSALSAPSRCALQQLCQRVTSLHLAYPIPIAVGSQRVQPISCSAVAQLLGTATSLQHFTLSIFSRIGLGVTMIEEEGDPQTRASWRRELALESFEISDLSSSYLSRLTTFFPVVQLKQLTLGGVDPDAMIPLVAIVRSCATMLEALSLCFITGSDGGREGMCFFRLPLEITLSPPSYYQPPCCALKAGFRASQLSVI